MDRFNKSPREQALANNIFVAMMASARGYEPGVNDEMFDQSARIAARCSLRWAAIFMAVEKEEKEEVE